MEKDRGFPLEHLRLVRLRAAPGRISRKNPGRRLRCGSPMVERRLDGYLGSTKRRLARRNGLEVENAHAPYDRCNDLWLPGEERARAAAGELIACVEDCAAAEVKTLGRPSDRRRAPPPCSPLGPLRLRPVVETAERRGVRLAFENLRHPLHLKRVLDTFDSPAVGLCYDSGHHHGWGRETDWLFEYGSRLFALHLHDNDGTRDSHAVPFDGGIDWKALSSRIAPDRLCGADRAGSGGGGGI